MFGLKTDGFCQPWQEPLRQCLESYFEAVEAVAAAVEGYVGLMTEQLEAVVEAGLEDGQEVAFDLQQPVTFFRAVKSRENTYLKLLPSYISFLICDVFPTKFEKPHENNTGFENGILLPKLF